MIKPEEELPLYIIVYIIVLTQKTARKCGVFRRKNETEQLSPQPLATTVNNLVEKHKEDKIYR